MLITPSYNPTAALKGVELLILDAKSVDEVVSTVVCPSPGIKNHTFTISVSASVTGAVTVESANDPAYAGIWNPLATAVDLNTLGAIGQAQVRLSNTVLTAVRVRISTVVSGGTVSVTYNGQ